MGKFRKKSETQDRLIRPKTWTNSELLGEADKLADEIAYKEGCRHPLVICINELARRYEIACVAEETRQGRGFETFFREGD